MSARLIIGDVRKVLDAMPAQSVDLVLTSPPFLALRSYLPVDHPDKPFEIGSEATPGEFIDTLLDVVEAAERVLAPHGSMCIELGDTYSGSGGAGGDYNEGGLRDGQERFDGSSSRAYGTGAAARPARVGRDRNRKNPMPAGEHSAGGGTGWPEAKSLCLIPEIFRFALVYGFNPLTGRPTPRWRARNVIRWVRPNPPVGALGDKFRPATSEMVVVCKDRRRYFDLDAVRHPADEANERPSVLKREGIPGRVDQVMNPLGGDGQRIIANPAGAPPLDWWKISTQPYEGSHYATWPEQLCIIPIKAMCPLKVCLVCGKPSERIVDVHRIGDKDDASRLAKAGTYRLNAHDQAPELGWEMSHQTTGWTDCGHHTWRTGVVLDPFSGSGTTLKVATGHGRDAIGIDIDARNADLALDRVGPMLLTVEHHQEALA